MCERTWFACVLAYMLVRVCVCIAIMSILTKELLRGVDHVKEPILVLLCVINITHSSGHAGHALVVD